MTASATSTSLTADLGQRDRAYQALRRVLILQQVNEGERLREPEWATRLGVNRMALREAFARLEAEGLIERGPKTGYFVPRLTDHDIAEILHVRAVLEGAAIDRIVRDGRNKPAHLGPLRQAIEQLESLIEQGYLLGAGEADRRFHETLIEHSGNRRLAMIYARAPLPMIHGRLLGTEGWASQMRETAREHRAILQAIIGGKVAEAQAMLRQHLDGRYLHGPIDRSERG